MVQISTSRAFTAEITKLSPQHQKRIESLINHYAFGTRLQGLDKESAEPYAAHRLRHFHVDLRRPDPLLFYQVKQGTLNLVAISTHAQALHGNETDFLRSIEADLLETRRRAAA